MPQPKYDSGTGWPSFSEAPGQNTNRLLIVERVEYHCAKCGAHHGHVFNDGQRNQAKDFVIVFV